MDDLLDPEWQAEVRERAPQIAAKFASQIGKGSRELSAAACGKGCSRCVRECAIREIAASWWLKELAIVEAAAAVTLNHNGVAYAEPAGRA